MTAGNGCPLIMGVVNATGDSFSEGRSSAPESAVGRALKLLDEGADWLDIGGESTRPGAETVSAEDEISRVLPVILEIRRRRPRAVLSLDTRKSEVARAVLEMVPGVMINDVSMLRYSGDMAETAASAGVKLIIGHSRGDPATMRNPEYCSYPRGVVEEVAEELMEARRKALAAGVPEERIILDPGFGFAKNAEQNWELLRGIGALCRMAPVLVGISRKNFIGDFLGESDPLRRLGGTVGAVVYAVSGGAAVVRVHDVFPVAQALKVWQYLNCR